MDRGHDKLEPLDDHLRLLHQLFHLLRQARKRQKVSLPLLWRSSGAERRGRDQYVPGYGAAYPASTAAASLTTAQPSEIPSHLTLASSQEEDSGRQHAVIAESQCLSPCTLHCVYLVVCLHKNHPLEGNKGHHLSLFTYTRFTSFPCALSLSSKGSLHFFISEPSCRHLDLSIVTIDNNI